MNVKTLKIISLSIGVAIIIGFVALIIGIIYKWNMLGEEKAEQPVTTVPFAPKTVVLPAGCRPGAMAVLSSGRIAVQVEGEQPDCWQILRISVTGVEKIVFKTVEQ